MKVACQKEKWHQNFINNGILGTSRKCSKDEEKGGTSAGQNSGYETSKWECRRRRIPDARHPGGMSAEKNSECETPGWNADGEEFRMRDIRMECRRGRIPDARHPDGMPAEKNSGCETSGWNEWEFPSGWNERCHASQGGPSACARERESHVAFLGRIP